MNNIPSNFEWFTKKGQLIKWLVYWLNHWLAGSSPLKISPRQAVGDCEVQTLAVDNGTNRNFDYVKTRERFTLKAFCQKLIIIYISTKNISRINIRLDELFLFSILFYFILFTYLSTWLFIYLFIYLFIFFLEGGLFIPIYYPCKFTKNVKTFTALHATLILLTGIPV